MNRPTRLRLAAALFAAACAIPAVAAEPQAPAAAEATSVETTRSEAAAGAKRADRLSERHCLRETGTRIVARGRSDGCAIAAGTVYTREDIDRTGAVDIADALRRLDTRIR